MTADVPFVRLISCNPLEIKDPGIPPAFSGYPAAYQAGWQAFRVEYERVHQPLWAQLNAWVMEQGAPALPDLEFIHVGAATYTFTQNYAITGASGRSDRPGIGWIPISRLDRLDRLMCS